MSQTAGMPGAKRFGPSVRAASTESGAQKIARAFAEAREPCGRDANHFERDTPDADLRAHDCRIAAEQCRPPGMAQNDQRRCAGFGCPVALGECPPACRADSNHLK